MEIIILTQGKETLLKVTNIMVAEKQTEKENGLPMIEAKQFYVITRDMIGSHILGTYPSEDKAKSVLKDITNRLQAHLKFGADMYYEMPDQS